MKYFLILLAIALLFSLGCSSIKNNPGSSSSITKTQENPFSLATTNIPFRPIYCGTGQPYRLRRDDVINTINNVFTSEGLEIVKDTLIIKDDLCITVDAYNPKHNIGYIWIGYDNFGEGTSMKSRINGSIYSDSKKLENQYLEDINRSYLNYLKNIDVFFQENNSEDSIRKALRIDLFNNLGVLPTENERKVYFFEKNIAAKLAGQLTYKQDNFRSKELSFWWLDISKKIDNPLEALVLLRRSHVIDQYIKIMSSHVRISIIQELSAINTTKNDTIWKQRTEALIKLMSIKKGNILKKEAEYCTLLCNVLNNYAWDDRKNQYHILKRFVDSQQVSYGDLITIDKASQKGSYFIAPLSLKDERMIYFPVYPWHHFEKNNFISKFLALINEADSQEEKDSLKNILTIYEKEYQIEEAKKLQRIQKKDELIKLIDLSSKKEEKDSLQQVLNQLRAGWRESNVQKSRQKNQHLKVEPLRLLEEDMREYIRWAKST